jgi:glutamate carboxypeptidase
MKHKIPRQVFVLLCALSCVSGTAAQDSVPVSQEEIIVNHVDEEFDRAVALLEASVNINSGSMNFAGVKAVADHLAPEFEELDFAVEWLGGSAFGRAGHLVASRGDRGPKILLIGHLDTVFPADGSFQRFEPVDEHHVRGPGTTDMKGGNIIMIQALRALRAANALDDISVRVVLTGDEELSGDPKSLRSAALVEGGIWADYAIGFEDGDGNPATAVVARRGSTGWILTTSGKRAHSSQIFQPEYGDGAIYEAARILNEFRIELTKEENLTFNPGVILGGTDVTHDDANNRGTAFGKDNVISSAVTVSGDVRAMSPAQLAFAKKRMQEIVADNLAVTLASIEFSSGYPPMAATEGNYALLEMFSQASVDLGFGEVVAVNPRNAGAADISFVASEVEMALDGVGLMGSGGHTLDEVADLRTLPVQTKRVAVLLHRLSKLR